MSIDAVQLTLENGRIIITHIPKRELYIMPRCLKPGEPTDNIPHDILVDLSSAPPRATKLGEGVTLYTKDGSRMGNAIVVKQLPIPPEMAEHMLKTNQKLWLVETDFGNRMKLTDSDINELFTLGHGQDYHTWWDARMAAIQNTVTP